MTLIEDCLEPADLLRMQKESVTLSSLLVRNILMIMRQRLNGTASGEEWELLFAAKPGNLVMQLQKLVQINGLLVKQTAAMFPPPPDQDLGENEPMSDEDMQVLLGWLKDTEPTGNNGERRYRYPTSGHQPPQA